MSLLTRAVLASSLFISSAALAQDGAQMPNIQMNIQVDGEDASSAHISVQGMDSGGGAQGVNMNMHMNMNTSGPRTAPPPQAAQPRREERMPERETRAPEREDRFAQRPDSAPAFRDCGTSSQDPGCTLRRDGQYPMDADTFRGILQSLKGVNNEITREEMAGKMLKRNYLSAAQFGLILDLFNNEITRLDVAKSAARRVVNPQHALGFSSKWNNSISAEEYVSLMSEQ